MAMLDEASPEISETLDQYIDRKRAFDPFWPAMLDLFVRANMAELRAMNGRD